MYSIAVKQIQLRAPRGVYDTESYINNEYWVDAVLEFSEMPLSIPNYEDLLDCILKSFEAHFEWIETWLERIEHRAQLAWPHARLTVHIQKRNPAFEGVQVASVEVSRVFTL